MADIITETIFATEQATYKYVKELFLNHSYDTAMDEIDRRIKELDR